MIPDCEEVLLSGCPVSLSTVLVLVVCRIEVFCAGKFLGQDMWFVNQDGQAMRAEGITLAAIFEREQGDFLGGAATIKAGFFGHA